MIGYIKVSGDEDMKNCSFVKIITHHKFISLNSIILHGKDHIYIIWKVNFTT
jgi:hypothetical protein